MDPFNKINKDNVLLIITLKDGLNFGLGNKRASGVQMAISWAGREVSRFPAKSFLPLKISIERKKFLPGTQRA
jgi:hypothetical protein